MCEKTVQNPPVLIVGCGYCGTALGKRLLASTRPREVWATTRGGAERVSALTQAGFGVVQGELEALPAQLPDALVQAGEIDVVYSAPPCRSEDHLAPVRAMLYGLTERVSVRACVYLGSTSVYGDAAGGAVDAETPLAPRSKRGEKRAQSEVLFTQWGREVETRVALLRLPGIYGPGRSIFARLRSGRYALVEGGHKWSARIHRDDVAMGAEVVLNTPEAHGAYLLCDNAPFQVKDLVAHACSLLQLPLPASVPIEVYRKERGDMAASFWTSSNRYDNRHIRALPGFALSYPSYREGLAALWEEEQGKTAKIL